MLLGNLEQISVFQIDRSGFQLLGVVDDVISTTWGKMFNKYCEVTMNVIPSERNLNLLKKGRFIWTGGDNAARIDIVEKSEDNGSISLKVKGMTLEKLLTQRTCGAFDFRNFYASRAMVSLVNDACIASSYAQEYREKVQMPYFEVISPVPSIGRIVGEVVWYGPLYERVKSYADSSDNLGFEILFQPSVPQLLFNVYETQDHTINSQSPVVFSSDMEAIINMDYYSSNRDFKNYVKVYGEGENWQRKFQKFGDETVTGYDRYEYFVDARDLQSEIGEGQTMSDEDYAEMLISRGKEKLAEVEEVETVSGKLNVSNSVFKYGIDYKIGDKITVVNNNLNLQVDARVTGIQETVGSSYSTEIIVGYELKTLSEKIKTLYS